MHVPYDLIKTFLTFCEAKNSYQAAEILGISQPAISVKLQSLESYLNKKVFEMQGKKKVVNKYGEYLYRKFATDFRQLDKNYELSLKWLKDPDSIELTIGARREMLRVFADKIKFNGCLNLKTMYTQDAMDGLQKREIDLAITYLPSPDSAIIQRKIFSYGSHFLLHKKWLKKKQKATLQIFQDEEFLKSTPGLFYSAKFPLIEKWLYYHQRSTDLLRPKLYFDDWPSIVELVEKGEGFTLAPDCFNSEDPNIIKIPVPHKIVPKIDFYLHYHNSIAQFVDKMEIATDL